MRTNDKIFLLSADFGAIALDKIRTKFPGRFINIGIAEQNLINVATGLALEGLIVYLYGISAFLTMRPFEQLRNLSLLSQTKNININLVGVGAGLSYDLSGPSHHCIEDITIMRLLPNFIVYSPSDWVLAERLVDLSAEVKQPKYIRLDGKPVRRIYQRKTDLSRGFSILKKSRDICFIATGNMVHRALEIAEELAKHSIGAGVIDLYRLKPIDGKSLMKATEMARGLVTMEEHLLAGGLGSAVGEIVADSGKTIPLKRFGIQDRYNYLCGDRNYIQTLYGLDKLSMVKKITKWVESL